MAIDVDRVDSTIEHLLFALLEKRSANTLAREIPVDDNFSNVGVVSLSPFAILVLREEPTDRGRSKSNEATGNQRDNAEGASRADGLEVRGHFSSWQVVPFAHTVFEDERPHSVDVRGRGAAERQGSPVFLYATHRCCLTGRAESGTKQRWPVARGPAAGTVPRIDRGELSGAGCSALSAGGGGHTQPRRGLIGVFEDRDLQP